tara:strand:- start:1581 stop:1856 length:276 start_codon:yes stop_codon:yes gene_type:complete
MMEHSLAIRNRRHALILCKIVIEETVRLADDESPEDGCRRWRGLWGWDQIVDLVDLQCLYILHRTPSNRRFCRAKMIVLSACAMAASSQRL